MATASTDSGGRRATGGAALREPAAAEPGVRGPALREPTAPDRGERIRVLRLMLAIGEEGAPYHHFTLAAPAHVRTDICTFFPVREAVPERIGVHAGPGTMRGFLRALDGALAAGPYDLVHAHTPHVALLYQLHRLRPGRRAAPPTVFTLHNSYDNLRARNRLMLLPIFAGFDRVVCCGAASLRSLPALHRRLAGRRLSAVPNGVDLERIDRVLGRRSAAPAAPRLEADSIRRRASVAAPEEVVGPEDVAGTEDVGAPEDVPAQEGERPFTVLAVNRLVEVKNPLTVLEAFARLPDPNARLVVIGIGPLRPAFERRAAELGLADRTELTGLIPREEVYARMAAADLFVSCSRGEGLPVAVLEAMACGRPVVLSDIPPHREIAAGADFVPLVRPDDVDGFARALRRHRALPRGRRLRLGRRCRRVVARRFSLRAMHRGYGAVYAELLGGRCR